MTKVDVFRLRSRLDGYNVGNNSWLGNILIVARLPSQECCCLRSAKRINISPRLAARFSCKSSVCATSLTSVSRNLVSETLLSFATASKSAKQFFNKRKKGGGKFDLFLFVFLQDRSASRASISPASSTSTWLAIPEISRIKFKFK